MIKRPPPRRREARWAWAGIVVVAAAVTWGLGAVANQSPFIADPLGYVTAGRQLAAGDGLSWRDEVNEIAGPFSSPMAFPVRTGDAAELRYSYPPGFPLVIAAAVRITGSAGAATQVNSVFGGLLVLASAWLAYEALRSRAAAFVAAAFVALVPDVWRFGSEAWADLPTAGFVAGGVAAILSALNASSRRGMTVGMTAAGLLLSGLIWLRPAALLVVASASLIVTLEWRRPHRRPWFPLVLFLGIIFLSIGALLFYNYVWYGDAATTGYSPAAGWYPQAPFSWRYAFGRSFIDEDSVPAIISAMLHDFGPLIVLIPAGLVVVRPTVARFMGASLFSVILPYAFYAFGARGVNARFILPVVPIAIVLVIAALSALIRRLPNRVRPYALASIAATIGVLLVPRSLDAWRSADSTAAMSGERVREAIAIAEATPSDSVLISYEWNDLLAVYGQRSVLNVRRIPPGDVEQRRYRTDLLPGCLTDAVQRLLRAGRPVIIIQGATPASINPIPILEASFALRADALDARLIHVSGPRTELSPATIEPCLTATVETSLQE